MKWLFVQKGEKNKVIRFVSCDNTGKPVRVFSDMNLASIYEQSSDFENSIAEFNRSSKARIEASLKGKEIEDTRPIISVKDFNKIQKDHVTKLKL